VQSGGWHSGCLLGGYVLLASLINLEAHGETSCARILIGIDGIIESIN